MASSYSGSSRTKLKLRDVEVKTRAVQQALAPLIEQVTQLTHSGATTRFNNRVRDVRNLIHIVSRAAEGFVATGEQIATENPDYQEEMLLACEEVRHAGDSLQQAANEYASDPLKKRKREVLQERSADLLIAATRLLVLADMIDISKILKATSRIEAKLRSLQESTNWEEFMGRLKQTAAEINTVSEMATVRLQADTKSTVAQQLLVEAQAELNSCNRMLVSTTKVYLQHRHVDQAKQNHDYVIGRMTDALHTIASLADGEDIEVIKARHTVPSLPPGDIAGSLDSIESLLDLSNKMSSVERLDHLHHHMDLVTSGTSVFADSTTTRDGVQGLQAQCDLMNEMLQDLASLFSHQSEGGSQRVGKMALQLAVGAVNEQASTLKSELHQVMVDQVSSVMVDPYQTLDALVESAQRGDEHAVMRCAEQFTNHADQMIKVAGMTCALSLDKEASSVTATAAQHLHSLAPEVVAAARTLCARPRNQLVQQNMMVFQEVWLENVSLLVDAVHNMTPINSLVTATESSVSEASHSLLHAATVKDLSAVKCHTHSVRAYCKQLVNLVTNDMRDNSVGYHDDKREVVSTALHQLGNVALVQLNEAVGIATERLSGGEHLSDVDMRLLKEDVDQLNRIVRGIGTMYTPATPQPEEDESDEQTDSEEGASISEEEGGGDSMSSSTTSEEDERINTPPAALPPVRAIETVMSPGSQRRLIKRTPSVAVIDTEDTAQAMMAQLPAHEQAKLAKVHEGLQIEKRELEREVSQWDDRENNIVLLAKEMCWMMMDLADFARGIGPLKVTADVTNTAIDIARGGEYLNVLARQIADLCPDRQCRSDLLAYLERIKLCCHQLRITSAVRADLDTTTSETVENASNMIVAAKNVMNAVVLIVKSCYIASVAITRREGSMPVQLVQWKMATPKKKTLYSQPTSATGSMSAIKELGEFRGRQVSHGRGKGQ